MRYLVHGLVVESDVALEARAADDDRTDLWIRTVDSIRGPQVDEPAILRWQLSDGNSIMATRSDGGGIVGEVPGILRCIVAPSLDAVSVELVDAGWGPIYVRGWLLAFLLTLRGRLVLHASAVALPTGEVVAIIGNSGMGKSTLAAALCRDGSTFITDDVANVEVVDGRAIIHPGSIAARLRPESAELASHVAHVTFEHTVDDRMSIVLSKQSDGPLPLDAVLVVWPLRDAASMVIDWLTPQVGVVEILQYPRVYEWIDPAVRATQFELVADLAGVVPVGHLSVPWGPLPAFDSSHALAIVLADPHLPR